MKFEEFLPLAERTLSEGFFCDDAKKQKLLHGAVGLATEAGEILDQMKKHIFYGRELDLVNIQEELWDVMRYFAIFCRELDLDFAEILDGNIEKLKKRFGEKFSQEKAINRDTEHELSHFSWKNS